LVTNRDAQRDLPLPHERWPIHVDSAYGIAEVEGVPVIGALYTTTPRHSAWALLLENEFLIAAGESP
jgi:hypothetical protein